MSRHTLVQTHHGLIRSILEVTRYLMTRQAALNTMVLGPMLEVRTTKTNKDREYAKIYTLFVDYDIDHHGRRVRVIVDRVNRWGWGKSTSFYVPSNILSLFECPDSWDDVHAPRLHEVLARTHALPTACLDERARVYLSGRVLE